MNKQYAVFDMDGTLVDSMGYWRNLGREYLRAKGITGDLAELLEEIRPMTMSESAELFIRRFFLKETVQGMIDQMNEAMDNHYREDIPLKKGAKEYLENLNSQGVRMCIASATAEPLVKACLSRLGVLEYFDFILSCESMGVSKREPDIYLAAAKRFGVQPSGIAVYEDALYAIETAKKAGLYVAAVYDAEAQKDWNSICRLADETLYFTGNL